MNIQRGIRQSVDTRIIKLERRVFRKHYKATSCSATILMKLNYIITMNSAAGFLRVPVQNNGVYYIVNNIFLCLFEKNLRERNMQTSFICEILTFFNTI